ncbi:MAG: hypothetical protein H6727_19880 [Myxococcales bacterium]|nr:hypothetical protein [Myxococcales bacterium]
MQLTPLFPRWSWPAPRSQMWILRILRFLWTLPTNVLGHTIGWCLSLQKPHYFEGPAAHGWFYRLPRFLPKMGAVALGHAILYSASFLDGPHASAIMAHELAHTRQHEWLGPFYLPAHILCQAVSLCLCLLGRKVVYSPVHDFNPLEQTWICLGVGAIGPLVQGKLLTPEEKETYLRLFGLREETRLPS